MKNWDKTFIEIAKLIAEHSTCVRKQVGALIVKDKRIVSTGYNGVPSGLKHCNKFFTENNLKEPDFYNKHGDFSKKFELHAEQNAILFAGKVYTSCEGATLYTTLSPCSDCCKLIAGAGIKRVVYCEEYDRDTAGIDLLKQLGIEVIQVAD